MSYYVVMRNPDNVQSPKRQLVLVSVILNTGEDGYAVALIRWDGEPKLAMRWNGTDDPNSIGSPQSRGYATWFVIPDEFQESVLESNNISRDNRALARNFFNPHQRTANSHR
jgi:hypothetical protein